MNDIMITTPITNEFLAGALELEDTEYGLLPHRLPSWAREQCADPQLMMAESQSSGVRLAFRTRATTIELDTLPVKRAYVGMPHRPDGFYDLCVNGELKAQRSLAGGIVLRINMAVGSVNTHVGLIGTMRFSDLSSSIKDIEIWLPHNETTHLVALRSDAPIEPIVDDQRKVWVHHGSSISHGSNAASPTGIWPAVAASLSNTALLNLGFGGSALLDPFIARTIKSIPADFISLKIGINLVNTDVMRLRAFIPAVHGFLDTIRDGHPVTPLLIISPIFCPIHEDTPGPSEIDPEALRTGRLQFRATGSRANTTQGKLTLCVIRDALAAIIEQRASSDRNVHYLDGRNVYGEADTRSLPLSDQLHPDAQTHQLMGHRFANLAFKSGGPFLE
jgi:hypothetical protein